MKYLLRILIVLALNILITVGCSSNENEIGEIVDSTDDTLVIGVDSQFPPLSYLDQNDNFTGFDIDLAKEVAKKLGKKLEIQPIDWTQKETELESGNIDVIWSGLTITPEREAQMLFTNPYLLNNQVIVVREDSGINTLNDLVDKNIGVQLTSTAESALSGNPIINEIGDVILYHENTSALEDLSAGKIDAVAVDSILAGWYLMNENSELAVLNEPLSSELYGIAVAKDNLALLEQLNNALYEIKTDELGTKISTKWFGNDVLLRTEFN